VSDAVNLRHLVVAASDRERARRHERRCAGRTRMLLPCY